MDGTSRILMVVSMGLLLLVGVFLISRLLAHIAAVGEPVASAVTVEAAAAADARIKPVGAVRSEDVTKPRPILSGKQIVGAVCAQCHGSGVLGAPKIGSHELWAARVAQGYAVLLKHAEEGFKNMPARGGDPRLSNDDLKRAIAYMVDESGFKSPKGWSTIGMPAAAKSAAGMPAS
ncbi:hypothetical protein Thpro_021643 [Acidihalobacter prosperus]|uniref:Cytochrome c domain-containing protein n=2 Tax=Acidihalobacter prosperus TaxID=160660 RepID=A0A1A6C447_9GAMM|nr:hypothetical protein Thpro_021643 [Acidihalobacter prosperus]